MTELPFVSVIMPVRNQADTLVRALGAVLDQRYPRERVEVLVVDALSDDATYAIAQRATYDRRVRLLDNPHLSTAAGLNVGLEHARGEVVVRVDGDTVVPPDYLSASVEALQRSGADSVRGVTRAVGASVWGRAAALAWSSPFSADQGLAHAAAYRRSALGRVVGWDEGLGMGEDEELGLRLRATGGSVQHAPWLRIVARSADTPGALLRQSFACGLWRASVLWRRPQATRASDAAAAALVVALGGGAPLAFLAGRLRRLWLALSALYALALAIASVAAARRLGSEPEGDDARVWRGGALGPLDGGARPESATTPAAVRLRLPLVFACTHLAYGSGLLAGLVRAVLVRNRAA